jgi:hypothetical protein
VNAAGFLTSSSSAGQGLDFVVVTGPLFCVKRGARRRLHYSLAYTHKKIVESVRLRFEFCSSRLRSSMNVLRRFSAPPAARAGAMTCGAALEHLLQVLVCLFHAWAPPPPACVCIRLSLVLGSSCRLTPLNPPAALCYRRPFFSLWR